MAAIAVTAAVAAALGYLAGRSHTGKSEASEEQTVREEQQTVRDEQQTVRLYTAMSCDLTHHGHYDLLQRGVDLLRLRLQAESNGAPVPRIQMVVGVCSDATVASYKRRPILKMSERAAAMRHCRHCDQVITSGSLVPPPPAPVHTVHPRSLEHSLCTGCLGSGGSLCHFD